MVLLFCLLIAIQYPLYGLLLTKAHQQRRFVLALYLVGAAHGIAVAFCLIFLIPK
jgi:hypothetical protein